MGSIVSINRNPRTWPAYESQKRLKDTGEPLMHIEYGTFDDYPEGALPMSMYMRQTVYQALLDRKYKVDYDRSKSELIIRNTETGEPIPKIASAIY